MSERCVRCGEIIPEGRQVCPNCEKGERKMAKCDSYHRHGNTYRCYSTREMEECTCGGDQSKCNFYPEKREQKAQKMANEKRLIDANALAKDLELLAKHEDSFRQSVILGIVHTVKAQPTVEAVEVVHGRWIKRLFADDGTTAYRCSECHTTWDANTNYCPNCGAKMDGDGNA